VLYELYHNKAITFSIKQMKQAFGQHMQNQQKMGKPVYVRKKRVNQHSSDNLWLSILLTDHKMAIKGKG
jgi:hypothetical protein